MYMFIILESKPFHCNAFWRSNCYTRAEQVKRINRSSDMLSIVKEVHIIHAWEAIQKSLDFIETNISEDVDIEHLAKESALSPFYYQRLLSRLVKKPVREYIKLRRLACAYKSLADKQRRILDIALDCGFGYKR